MSDAAPVALLALPVAGAVVWCGRRDAVSLLTVLLFTVYGFSAHFVLGAAGPPSLLLGLGCLALWARHALLTRTGAPGSPVRPACLALGWSMLLAFAVAATRVITPEEQRSSLRRIAFMLAAVGVALYVADRVTDRDRLDALLRRVVLGVTFMAVIGIVQYSAGRGEDLAVVPPGLGYERASSVAIDERSTLRRVASTAGHAIEFGVVLATVLPLALHYALTARPGWRRRLAWAQVLVLGAALPMSISRSAVISVAVGMVVLAVVWDGRRRLNFAVALIVFLGVLRLLFPGLLGTLRSFFLNAGDDPSVSGRLEDYGMVEQLVSRNPVFGQGFGTFIPNQYFFLDNQLLGTLIESGIVGVLFLLGWFVVAVGTARGISRRAVRAEDRQLGQALAACVLGAGFSFATFDALWYNTLTVSLFVFVGAAGALWRLTVAPGTPGARSHWLASREPAVETGTVAARGGAA